MSHALFSILPLMIGVFGGTVSAIVIIRNVGNQRVKDNLDAIEKMLHKLLGIGGFKSSTNYSDICSYRDKVERCRKAFTNFTLYPVIIFTAWIITVSFCVSLNGNCIKALNSPYGHNTSELAKDGSQAKKNASPDLNLPREVMDRTTEYLGSVLLGAKIILSVTFVDLVFIVASLCYLRRAKTQYNEVRKKYQTITGNWPEDDDTLRKTGGTTV